MYFSFCLHINENKHGGAGQASRPLGSSFELLALVSKEMHNVTGTPPSSMCVTAYNVNQITSGGVKSGCYLEISHNGCTKNMLFVS